MIYLKIIAQLITGVSGLLALLLDYKWHDGRRTIFKKMRNALMILSIISLICGIVVVINDESDKNIEILTLKNKLDTAQNTLSYIKLNGDTLNSRIKPFIDLAINRYPNLSLKDALDSLRSSIFNLDRKTSNLQHIESLRSTEELTFKKLKETSPSIGMKLLMDVKRNIYLELFFLNKVPINIKYALAHSIDGKVHSTSGNSIIDIYPPRNNNRIIYKDDFNFPDHIPKDKISYIQLTATFESIYLKESNDSKLQRTAVKYYVINPFENSIKEKEIN